MREHGAKGGQGVAAAAAATRSGGGRTCESGDGKMPTLTVYQQYLLYLWCPFCSCDVLQVMACGEMWQGTDWGDGGGRVV